MSPAVGAQKGSRHKPRAMVALLPEVNGILVDYARRQKRPARWELHDILLGFFVTKGVITQEKADQIWQTLSRSRD